MVWVQLLANLSGSDHLSAVYFGEKLIELFGTMASFYS